MTCCDLYNDVSGDWTVCIAPQYGLYGNICENPLFCRSQNLDCPYSLQEGSPCTETANPDCGLIGAWPIGCETVVAVEPASWGLLKSLYRR